MRYLAFLSAVLVSASAAQAAPLPQGKWGSQPGQFKVTYTIVHKFHEVKGVSSMGEGRALVGPAGVQVQARVLVSSFDSGNANRDSNAMSVVDAVKYPYVSFKGTGPACDLQNGSCTIALTGVVDFHGVQQTYSVPLRLDESPNGRLHATFKIPMTLTKHNIERPSLLFVPIDDTMDVEGDATMEKLP